MATFTSLETLTTAYSTTSCSVDDMGSLDDVYTTATGIATTLSSVGSSPSINITVADRYIDSLSDTQLAELDQRLTEKESETIVIDGNTYTFSQIMNENSEPEKIKVNIKA